MDDKIKFERNLRKAGDSIVFSVPKEILDYINSNDGDQIFVMPEYGKHGKYISIWKKQK